MNINFDKRLELIYGILYCVNKDLNNELFSGLFKDELPNYNKEFYTMYKKGITEEFIDFIKNYGLASNWNQPAFIALSLDENYNIVENKELRENVALKNDKFNKEKLERLLKEFVVNSNYEDFYNNHKFFYDNIVNEYKKSMSKYNVFDENVIQDFYGYKLGEMNIKLYNFTTGSMGILMGDSQYYIQRVDNIGGDENNFKFKSKINTIFHEFSHPYINPLVDKYYSEFDFTNLYEEVKQNGLSTAYKKMIPYEILKEYLVRTIALYLESKYSDEESITKRIEIEKSSGFIHIEELVKLFDNKDNYNSFEDFFAKEIVELCIDINNRINKKKINL